MKKILSVLLFLVLALSINAQSFNWVCEGAFPDTTKLKLINSLHGIAVDPDGKVWLQDYYVSTVDSVGVTIKGVLTWYKVRVLRIYKPDGTEASFSPMLTVTVNGVKDTLGGTRVNDSTWSANTGRGMAVAPDGNILASYFGTIYKINYKTGEGMMKIVVDNVNSITRAAADSAGNIFVANVAPGYGLRMYTATGSSLGNAIDATSGYSRGFEVSYDGNTIFWSGYDKYMIKIYSRPDDLSPFTLKDSLMGPTTESMCRDPKDKGYIWICAGPADGPPNDPRFASHTFYKVNVTTKAITDSMAMPFVGTSDAKHRGFWFTKNADTCYITAWPVTAAQMTAPKVVRMVKKPVAVEPENMVASSYTLGQNYPNPFNPSTQIKFSIAKAGHVSLKVYDVLGREVSTLVNEFRTAGNYQVGFNAATLSSGTYVYRLTVNGIALTQKMAFVK